LRFRGVLVALLNNLEVGGERLLVSPLPLQLIGLPEIRLTGFGPQGEAVGPIAPHDEQQEQPRQEAGHFHDAKQSPHGSTGMGLNAEN
jgi:hypothetical protein